MAKALREVQWQDQDPLLEEIEAVLEESRTVDGIIFRLGQPAPADKGNLKETTYLSNPAANLKEKENTYLSNPAANLKEKRYTYLSNLTTADLKEKNTYPVPLSFPDHGPRRSEKEAVDYEASATLEKFGGEGEDARKRFAAWRKCWSSCEEELTRRGATPAILYAKLLSCLEPEKKAHKIAIHFEEADDAYGEALKALEERYGSAISMARDYLRQRDGPEGLQAAKDLSKRLIKAKDTLATAGITAGDILLHQATLNVLPPSYQAEERWEAWIAKRKRDWKNASATEETKKFDLGALYKTRGVHAFLEDLGAEMEGQGHAADDAIACAARAAPPLNRAIAAKTAAHAAAPEEDAALLARCPLCGSERHLVPDCQKLHLVSADDYRKKMGALCRRCGIARHSSAHRCTARCSVCGSKHLTRRHGKVEEDFPRQQQQQQQQQHQKRPRDNSGPRQAKKPRQGPSAQPRRPLPAPAAAAAAAAAPAGASTAFAADFGTFMLQKNGFAAVPAAPAAQGAPGGSKRKRAGRKIKKEKAEDDKKPGSDGPKA